MNLCINRIKKLDDVAKNLFEITENQKILFEEYKNNSYKEKYKKEHDRRKELERESQRIIDELTVSLKKAERENRKLKREVQV